MSRPTMFWVRDKTHRRPQQASSPRRHLISQVPSLWPWSQNSNERIEVCKPLRRQDQPVIVVDYSTKTNCDNRTCISTDCAFTNSRLKSISCCDGCCKLFVQHSGSLERQGNRPSGPFHDYPEPCRDSRRSKPHAQQQGQNDTQDGRLHGVFGHRNIHAQAVARELGFDNVNAPVNCCQNLSLDRERACRGGERNNHDRRSGPFMHGALDQCDDSHHNLVVNPNDNSDSNHRSYNGMNNKTINSRHDGNEYDLRTVKYRIYSRIPPQSKSTSILGRPSVTNLPPHNIQHISPGQNQHFDRFLLARAAREDHQRCRNDFTRSCLACRHRDRNNARPHSGSTASADYIPCNTMGTRSSIGNAGARNDNSSQERTRSCERSRIPIVNSNNRDRTNGVRLHKGRCGMRPSTVFHDIQNTLVSQCQGQNGNGVIHNLSRGRGGTNSNQKGNRNGSCKSPPSSVTLVNLSDEDF